MSGATCSLTTCFIQSSHNRQFKLQGTIQITIQVAMDIVALDYFFTSESSCPFSISYKPYLHLFITFTCVGNLALFYFVGVTFEVLKLCQIYPRSLKKALKNIDLDSKVGKGEN